MKHILTYFLILMGMTLYLEAAVRSDVVVIEASEGVQNSTQEIAKDYLLHYIYPEKRAFKKNLYENLIKLDSNIKSIATNTKDKKTKGILSYFATQKAEIMALLKKKSTLDEAESMVGFSEIFSEGSKSIMKHHIYDFSKEENMLMLTKEMRTLLGSIVKYYIAIEINPKDKAYRKKLQHAMDQFEKNLKQINDYVYNDQIKDTKRYLNRSWSVMQTYLQRVDEIKAPALLSLSSKNMQSALETLSIYHSKNQ